MPGDELDVTLPEKPLESETVNKSEAHKEHEHVTLAEISTSSSEGLNILQKVTFIGVIFAVVAMFLKTRKTPGAAEKSIA